MIKWWKSISCRHKYERIDDQYRPYTVFFPQCEMIIKRCTKCGVTKTIYR